MTECLRAALADSDAWVRYYACQAIGRQRHESAVDLVIERTDDPAGQVRVAALEALASLRTEASIQALRRAVASGDPDVRRAALVGLGAAHDEAALPTLLEAAADGDPATRLVALAALAPFDAPAAVAALGRGARDSDQAVRSAAIAHLASHPGADATHRLIELLRDPAIRERCVDALSQTAEGRVEAIAAALDGAEDDEASLLVAALARCRDARARSALIDCLEATSAATRRLAAIALGALGSGAARAALTRAATQDADPDVRAACARALGR